MKKEIMIFLSIAIGAGIGGLLSLNLQLQFNLNLLFTLVGGFAGYLVYDFEHLVKAVPEAYKATCVRLRSVDFVKKAKSITRNLIATLW